MDKYYTIGQAAKILGVSQETLRRWDNSGKIKSLRHPMNNYRVYSDNQIQNLVQDIQSDCFYKPIEV